jgi:hypothetical protein
MRRYDEPIEVRRGLVAGQEAPEQFIWRDRLWVVRDIVSHWVETGAWWEQSGIAALLGVGAEAAATSGSAPPAGESGVPLGAELLAEVDMWRVEAFRGRPRRRDALRRTTHETDCVDESPDAEADDGLTYGVFDLAFDWTQAGWRLVGCVD